MYPPYGLRFFQKKSRGGGKCMLPMVTHQTSALRQGGLYLDNFIIEMQTIWL